MMREGSLDVPIRRPIPWKDPEWTNEQALDTELRRVFDICHGCRRCFNLCDSFPRLFDLIDNSTSGELDSVSSDGFDPVVDACTMCDLCFMTKCPYVPPHEFDLDFPHLMLRARAVQKKKGKVPLGIRMLTETDRNGKVATQASGLANWASARNNALTRPVMQWTLGVARDAELPTFNQGTQLRKFGDGIPQPNPQGPAFGREVAIYLTCFSNYNEAEITSSAFRVLAHQGFTVHATYPECCGMPQWEQGDVGRVAGKAASIAAALRPFVEKKIPIIAPVPSCALMLKFEWPLVLPDNESVKELAQSTYDLSEFIVGLTLDKHPSRTSAGLAAGLGKIKESVALHIACHARAQNMARKGEQMLRLIPELDLTVVERCSGHGGSFGITEKGFPISMKIGEPVFKAMDGEDPHVVVSECPLSGLHIRQGIEVEHRKTDATIRQGTRQDSGPGAIRRLGHPIELIDQAYREGGAY